MKKYIYLTALIFVLIIWSLIAVKAYLFFFPGEKKSDIFNIPVTVPGEEIEFHEIGRGKMKLTFEFSDPVIINHYPEKESVRVVYSVATIDTTFTRGNFTINFHALLDSKENYCKYDIKIREDEHQINTVLDAADPAAKKIIKQIRREKIFNLFTGFGIGKKYQIFKSEQFNFTDIDLSLSLGIAIKRRLLIYPEIDSGTAWLKVGYLW